MLQDREKPGKTEQREFEAGDQDLLMSKGGKLKGLAICVSGTFENITREKLEYFVRQNDGKLASSVSSKTSILVVGKLLDDNRPVTEGGKYKAALRFGTKVMTEKEFEMFCRDKFENPDFILGRKTKKDTTERAQEYFVGAPVGTQEIDGVQDITDLLEKQTASSFNYKSSPKPKTLQNNVPSQA